MHRILCEPGDIRKEYLRELHKVNKSIVISLHCICIFVI